MDRHSRGNERDAGYRVNRAIYRIMIKSEVMTNSNYGNLSDAHSNI